MKKTVVFTFSRMNPPTIGHERVISTIIETAGKYKADHKVYLSQTCKAPSDPLDWEFKLRICKAAFPGVSISEDADIKTPFQALENLSSQYDRAILVVGQDQVNEFKTRMTKYAKIWNIDFHIVSAGNRNPESDGIEGVSATKLREYAVNGNKEAFFSNMPSNIKRDAKKLIYSNTIKGMKMP